MKTILIVLVGLIVCSSAFQVSENMETCQATLIEIISGETSSENIISSVPKLLNACGFSHVAEKLNFSWECVEDLSKAKNILQQISTEDNIAKLALQLTILKSLYTKKIQKSCTFLNVVKINPSNSSGVCLQAAYQLSLDVQTMWQHLTQGNYPVAFADLEKLLDDVPDTLDTCGDHTLADKIRKQFPAACLRSFDKLVKELSKIEHNFDHLEWLVKHGKEILGTFNDVRKSCPIFA